jgi:hypothetical protein
MSRPLGDSFSAYISGGFDPERHVEKFSMNFFGNQRDTGPREALDCGDLSEGDRRMLYGLETRKE